VARHDKDDMKKAWSSWVTKKSNSRWW